MTIHIVYPFEAPSGKSAAAPWTIGRELGRAFRRRGHVVEQYDWDEQLVIHPGPGDVLLGHPHPEAGRVFRSSAWGPWQAVFGIGPWNGSTEYTERMDATVRLASHTFLICGERWWYSLPEAWKVKATRLDGFITLDQFPWLRTMESEKGRRRGLYVGCTVPGKGTGYLERLIVASGADISHAGYGLVSGSKELGWVDFTTDAGRFLVAGHDFLVMTGDHDANPTTVLEAMAWGLVPVLTTGCGWTPDDLEAFWLPDGDARHGAKVLMDVQTADLEAMAKANRERVAAFSAERFTAPIIAAVEAVL